jgi:eukaryotic-like serine/threonine-protein kinase
MTCPYDVDDIVRGGPPAATYRLVRHLAESPLAFPFEAHDLGEDRRVVLEILRRTISEDDLQRECSALAALTHPGVGRVLSFGLTRDAHRAPYVVVPRLRGTSLRSALDAQGPFELPRSLDYGIQVFRAMAYAHGARVLHRDLHPGSIFLERTGPTTDRVVLLGLGFPHAQGAPAALDFIAHPAYAAPELFYGRAPSIATDIYAAGLVLFKMLTGTSALGEEGDRADWAHAHCFCVAPPLDALLPHPPPSLTALVASLLSKPVRRRPASAAACAQALSGILGKLARTTASDSASATA